MTISIWRYSHLLLAISSSLFLLIASVTGIVLAFEPISDSIKSFHIKGSNDLSVAETIHTLQHHYDEIISFEIDSNNAMIASVITKEGNSETIYVDPTNGGKLGKPIEKATVFKFATNLHRSLFLKSTGRFFVGFVSFILFIIAITGVLLILKRQRSIKRFFFKIEKEYFAQFYHIILGRLLLIPILLIAVTGVYLSLEKFSLLPKSTISHQVSIENSGSTPKIAIKDFDIFKTITLKNVKAIEFPFSDSVEDYFLIKLSDRELIVNQFTGAIISEELYPFVTLASQWSMVLHTGKGNILWSTILLIASCSILFFMYSGFTMTIKRHKKSKLRHSNHNKDESEYIILVGSETGNTFTFATLFANALAAIGKTVFISELNNYSSYRQARHLIIFTSTYGEGEPPTNAKKFEQKFKAIRPINSIQFSVVGLGSLAYPDFCKYALDVNHTLASHPLFTSVLEPYKINNQSFEAFKDWVSIWSSTLKISLHIKQPQKKKKRKNNVFTIIERTPINEDDTFLLRLRTKRTIDFQSGDLFSFSPKEDEIERLYSIGKVNGDILLSIKKHELGICSNYFSKLQKGDTIKASIKQNSTFHFPNIRKEVIMIANGTGIAPFLGMIASEKNMSNTHLFWGGRTRASLEIYNDFIKKEQLSSFHTAYSQTQKDKIYVQDLITKEANLISNVLKNNGIIMICGSIGMQKEVLHVLETISRKNLNLPLSIFEKKNQIKVDCY
ncbi:PepSY domain-containing protein [Aquimarina algiphila]|uniref:PepSY domain-containing protein n=1 Tax=Aquimarina algiphila TaxID=2047982 RepID=UPI0024922660|nr:PepSY domain-containing protein [Aquimarina algiphila]